MSEKAKYVLNPDADKVDRVRKGLTLKKEKYGEEYCPCLLPKFHSPDTICNCREYRETGYCRCGLWIE